MDVIDDHFFIGAKEHEVYRIVKNEEELIHALRLFEEELHDRCRLPHSNSADQSQPQEKSTSSQL